MLDWLLIDSASLVASIFTVLLPIQLSKVAGFKKVKIAHFLMVFCVFRIDPG
jgi:hypothetical protein